jgi:hypothetical protein
MSSPLILLSSILISFLMITMQYSGAQNIVPISKETQITPDEEPEVQGTPEAPDKEPEAPDKEPEAQVEEPKEQKEEPSGVDEGEPEVKSEDKSEEQSTPGATGKGAVGGLDIANTTQQTLPPAYKIKLIFDAIKPNYLGGTYEHVGCSDLDMGVYVQGKLVRLNNINQPLKVCTGKTTQLKDAETTVEIPGESVESVKDYQPLSIFSAGSELNKCDPKPLPTDLPEVRKILSDKGTTRPYYAQADKEIQKIRNEISNGCIEKHWTSIYNCRTWNFQTVCPEGNHNESLKNLDYVFESPGYGKVVPKNTGGNPERVQIDTCSYSPYESTSKFCLYYTIECPLCPAIRVH